MPDTSVVSKPGDVCGSCKKGHLAAVFRSYEVRNQPVGGPPGPDPYIHKLVCSGCGLACASALSGTLHDLLRQQLWGFKQPLHQPTRCDVCEQGASDCYFPLMTTFGGRTGRRVPAKKVLCCRSCVRLLWSFPGDYELV